MASTPRSKRTDTNWLRTEIQSEFNKLSELMSIKLREAEMSRAQLQESFENVKHEVAAVKEELIADLQRLHDETIQLAEKLKQRVEEKIQTYIDDLELRNFSITASLDRIAHHKSTFSAQKEMEYLQRTQSDVAKIQSLESRTLNFKRSNMLLNFVRQINNFGSVDIVCGANGYDEESVKDKRSDFIPAPQAIIDDYVNTLFPDALASSKDGTPTEVQNTFQPSLRDSAVTGFPLAKATCTSNYRATNWEGRFRLQMSDKHKVTEACCLNGIAVLDNKYIAVCDSPHDCIQLFNGNYDLLEEVWCNKPRGICTVSKDAFAVSLHGQPVVKLLAIENSKFSWTSELKIPCKTWIRDIKHTGKCMFLLCDDGDIHRINFKGKGEGMFPTGLGKHRCRHLAISKDASRFYISGEESVVCLDNEGKQLWKYCDPLTKTEGRGLAVFDNHIFVSDWKNSCLIELTEDGKVANITKDIGYPYALFIVEGERYGKVFVTQFSRFVSRETRSCIHVYRIGKANETQ